VPVIAVDTNRYRCGTTCRAVGAIYIRSVADHRNLWKQSAETVAQELKEGGCAIRVVCV